MQVLHFDPTRLQLVASLFLVCCSRHTVGKILVLGRI